MRSGWRRASRCCTRWPGSRADAAVTGAVKDIDTEAHQALLERQRKAALDELFDGSEESALALQLLRHPNETATVLASLKDNREKETALKLAALSADRQHYLALLDRALANDLINDDDAQPLRDLLFGQAGGGGLTGSTTMVPIASKPPLSLPPGVGPGTAAPAPSFGASSSASGPGAQTPPAASPVAQGWVVEDVVVTSPAEEPDPNAGQPAAGSAAGGVSGWKQIKRPGQG